MGSPPWIPIWRSGRVSWVPGWGAELQVLSFHWSPCLPSPSCKARKGSKVLRDARTPLSAFSLLGSLP